MPEGCAKRWIYYHQFKLKLHTPVLLHYFSTSCTVFDFCIEEKLERYISMPASQHGQFFRTCIDSFTLPLEPTACCGNTTGVEFFDVPCLHRMYVKQLSNASLAKFDMPAHCTSCRVCAYCSHGAHCHHTSPSEFCFQHVCPWCVWS